MGLNYIVCPINNPFNSGQRNVSGQNKTPWFWGICHNVTALNKKTMVNVIAYFFHLCQIYRQSHNTCPNCSCTKETLNDLRVESLGVPLLSTGAKFPTHCSIHISRILHFMNFMLTPLTLKKVLNLQPLITNCMWEFKGRIFLAVIKSSIHVMFIVPIFFLNCRTYNECYVC